MPFPSSARVDSHIGAQRPIPVLAALAGMTISTVYMVQPVLGMLAESFGLVPAELARVPATMQGFYALGLLLVVPLADALELRAFVRLMLLGLSLSLLGLCLATNQLGLLLASACLGLSATVTQVFIPIAAKWSDPGSRARSVGTVVSGILAGVLLSRVASGFLGERLGWRSAYLVDAALLACAWVLVPRWLRHPMHPPAGAPRWFEAWKARPQVLLQWALWRAIGIQGLLFASMMALWNTMGAHLAHDGAGHGAALTGMLGIVGLCGVLVAPHVGRCIDRLGDGPVVAMTLLLHGGGFLYLALCPIGWGHLAFGILLVDVGLHAAHIANQASLQHLDVHAGHRLNSLFMSGVFVFGALGSWSGLYLYGYGGWGGVCTLGLLCTFLAGLLFVAVRARQKC